MTKTTLIASLREARAGYTTTVQTLTALESNGDRLINEIWSQLSDVEHRKLVRHLNSVWRKHKNNNFAFSFAVLNKAIAILEKQKG